MGQQAYFATLARYHRWAHARLLAALAPIPDRDYYADQGLFFRSIHRTLNHLLLVDLLWHGRLTGKPFGIKELDQELVKERGQLAEEMLREAEALQGLVAKLDERRFESPNPYVDTRGYTREF